MAGYTKADYDNAYRCYVEPYLTGRDPAATHDPVVIHYHKWRRRPLMLTRWVKWQSILNLTTDPTCVVGVGFGWGLEGIKAAVSGINVVGIDVSDYVDAEKNNTETAELRQAITDAGLDPDTGEGATILAAIDDGQPRTDPSVIVLKEDAQTNTSRQAIRSTLGAWPDQVIFEDTVDDSVTDAEIQQADNAANLFSGSQRVVWIITPTEARTAADMKLLVPTSEVLTVNGEYVP